MSSAKSSLTDELGEVVTDSTFTQDPARKNWSAMGGWNNVHVSTHMRRGQPIGANILFLDWHVDFRPFANPVKEGTLRPRVKYGSPQIEFWF